ncbi:MULTISPECIES: phosphoenolpyruvate mutase [unclassified Bacillus (in: firmicutes)]|uniref:phosphoenolpyruvate mutase n=1 Tax=unclassified Bacillus (in: firmicutes) TaxID=185979 RepID=UPI0008DEF82F|nr:MULTISPECIES: phosphoenolpyruvate mutase [unclassified Bacillus (in: firmicutes)]SFA77888.1 phosphoenolpyruvate mutase [Bacillus sp. UNCCL13]SFQ67776.1 phosphoenolpyruvate mutase [Bacillus sp. cl95]
MKKTTQLRNMINSDQLELIMEAHNALSAKIVESAGFKGIWASGLSISAALGVRDNNEASWTQVLEVLEFMSDATSIPILLDGDTGYGNFNNARRLVKKLEQRGIAGVCIEDKLFPKTNSFINGEAQPLADIDEFCHKIRAMKDTQEDEDFVVVSRVEAFIAGWGLREALRRAEAYRQAGTDAILIHSKKSDSSEIETFMKEWGNRLPVIIVPTKYYKEPTSKFRDLGISVGIWANHNLRASITAMEKTSKQIYLEESLINVEPSVASLEKVFQLQGQDELDLAERKYLPKTKNLTSSIIFPGNETENPLLEKQIEQLNNAGIKSITQIGKSASQNLSEGREVYQLYQAMNQLKGDTIFSYAEMIYKPHVLEELLDDSADIVLVVDGDFERGKDKLFVTASSPYSKNSYSKTVNFLSMYESKDFQIQIPHGEFIGLWKVNEKGATVLKEALEKIAQRDDFKLLTLAQLFNQIANTHPIMVKYIKGQWLDLASFKSIESGELP